MIRPDTKILHVESSSVCNAACPMCARNINGSENKDLKTSSLSARWFKENINPDVFQQLDKIFFCGNLGDPCAAPELLDIIEYAKQSNPKITVGINTNGSIRNSTWWKHCAELLSGHLDYVVWSIDGLEDTNHLYRWNVPWKKVMDNCQAYINAGGTAHWDMLVFDHNKHQIDDCLQLATELGFSWFRIKETDRWDAYPDLKIKSASKYHTVDYNSVTDVDCERNREHSEYIDSHGTVWPCCHIPESISNPVSKHLYQDLLNYSAKEICSVYQEKLDSKTPFKACKRSCGVFQNKRLQWKKEVCIK